MRARTVSGSRSLMSTAPWERDDAALLLHVGAHLDLGSLLAMRAANRKNRDVRGGSFGRKRGRGARLRGLDFWEG